MLQHRHRFCGTRATCQLLLLWACVAAPLCGQTPTWAERTEQWNGFPQHHLTIAARPAYLVAPEVPPALDKQGKPLWIWRARFPGFHAEMDIDLVKRGYHIAYVDVAGMFGGPQAMEIGDAFYQHLTGKLGFSDRPVLEGVSRGGLFVYNWAARHPERVACIYCDTPVLDFNSWPGGKGTGLGAPREWQQCLEAYGLSEDEAVQFPQIPVHQTAVIAQARIPLLHIVSESDRVVPPAENTYLVKQRLEAQSGSMEVISVPQGTEKSNGHHFTHPAPDQVVQFILKHTGQP
ncbi:alpha/beta hydrolase family protein [Aureliella helgolandensis]|uniref:Alpha/beta hydrolase family protein n=1 Tax=Aureliella helgolandensis TaxID=2527968 RepID=A0A518GAJ1_9BACT|nr:alpha/beta hydrolase [Aureliella helgolandensis]QDV25618.1 Alpha/beta hydrolase family protein [Aureliella helgolandensis]